MAQGVTCSPENPCTAVQLLSRELVAQKEDMGDMKKAVEKLQNRLPLWATMLISTLTFTVGILAKW